jgi:hemolysin III
MSNSEAKKLLPKYTLGEELWNSISHGIGALFGIFVLITTLLKAEGAREIVACAIYGASLILLYTVSCVYHSLAPCVGKRVMQILDHCTIYFLIAGTYTPAALIGVHNADAKMAWIVFGLVWTLLIPAVVLTAVNMEKFSKVSMVFYIGMGWCIAIDFSAAVEGMGVVGFGFMLAGGIAYTIGAIIYGVGKKHKYLHSVFHIFVVIGSVLQYISIIGYCM